MQAYDIKDLKAGFTFQQLRARGTHPRWLHKDKGCCILPGETILCWPITCVAPSKFTWMVTRWFKAQGKTLPLDNVLFTKGGQR